jgi:hypothetical protein
MRRIVRILIWIVYLLAAAATALLAESRKAPPARDVRAAAAGIVAKIIRADYEDDRPALLRHYEELAPFLEEKALVSRIRYWRGFALWRRVLNGYNDKAPREEQEKDSRGCAAEFEQAVASDPSFVDARLGRASCLFGLSRLVTEDTESRDKAVKLFGELREEAKTTAADNPRVLLILGATLWFLPEEKGGGQAKSMETYAQGLRAARRHAKEKSDPLEPSWGEAELLSSLAWANLHRDTPDLEAAEANARAALAIVPTWHYARDILMPQIQEAKGKKPSATPSPAPAAR